MRLDPQHYAVRGDLADVELANEVFAPHYARAKAYRCVARRASIHAAADPSSEVRATLAKGNAFHVLDLSGGWAWGRCDAASSVGYVRADAIVPA